jgi:hypothetical protein
LKRYHFDAVLTVPPNRLPTGLMAARPARQAAVRPLIRASGGRQAAERIAPTGSPRATGRFHFDVAESAQISAACARRRRAGEKDVRITQSKAPDAANVEG